MHEGGEGDHGPVEELGLEHLAADVHVQPHQLDAVAAPGPVEGGLGVTGGQTEPELGVDLAGLDVLVGVGLDARCHPDQHPGRSGPGGHEGLDTVEFVEGIDDDASDPGGQGPLSSATDLLLP